MIKSRLTEIVRTFALSCILAAGDALASTMEFPSMDEYPHMPYVVKNPGAQYAGDTRMFQGIPSIEAAPNGRLWATWYGGGTGESLENYVLLATSGDDGRTWSKPVMVIDPPFRASEPALWLDPGGTLWFMFNLFPIRSAVDDRLTMEKKFKDIRAYNHFMGANTFVGCQLWVMTTDTPDRGEPVWSEPRLVAMETHNMNKPTVLSDGTWVWPSSPLKSPRGLPVRPLYSNNNGKSFFYKGAVPVPPQTRNADEYQITERKDKSLWLLNRMKYGIGESFSTDGGTTWTEMAPSQIAHITSRFYITRLQSGKLLLVKHGAIKSNVGRSQLMAFLSDDDGNNWTGGLVIDERNDLSYPDGTQAKDGRIYIIYDYQRHREKEILMATFTEEDVAAGKVVSEKTRFRQIVNKATARNPRHDKVPATADFILNTGGETPQGDTAVSAISAPLAKGDRPTVKASATVITDKVSEGATLFADRIYAWNRPPAAFEDLQFIRMPMDKAGSVMFETSGIVYVATPSPNLPGGADLNPFSNEAALIKQGFRKSDMPGFCIFGQAKRDVVSVFQKTVSAGEQVRIKKWAVIIF
ncbi:hypothetical protein OpiT1DRAFT_04191 [Opitutaceae bacterium TAV1]|nr:hypothetical protein OpiT1DRAFT_04191 [Opitutaceae bacterium TAV1]